MAMADLDMNRTLRRSIAAAAAVLALVLAPAARSERAAGPLATSEPAHHARRADFGGREASPQVRHVADWVAHSGDNGDAEFLLLDKAQATLYVFDVQARLRDATPVLLGLARGDRSVEGIGTRPIAEVRPHERTTPAGRFIAERGRNATGEDVIWVDYDLALSMHRVRATQPKERRLQRLASRTAADNRISYGCINVPVAFYEAVVKPTFASRRAIVYVLPEEQSAEQVFGSYDVAAGRAARLR
jgi:hypothetical protein